MNILRFSIASLIVLSLLFLHILPQIPIVNIITNKKIAADIPKLYKYPIAKNGFSPAPQISARSAVVVDAKTGITLFEKDPNIHHMPASTAKLLTAIVALEKCEEELLIKVGNVQTTPSVMGLEAGDVVSVKTLLNGLLIASGNDAALALSTACAASTDEFVKEMNLKAKELDMHSSHFTNPAGFDNPEQFTTARDLAKLAKVAIANPQIAKIVKTQQIVLTDAYNLKTYYLSNINKLLGQVEGIEGIKTGQTEGSLEVLITQTTREGNTIIAVVLGSNDRFLDSIQLIEWTFANHQWQDPHLEEAPSNQSPSTATE